MCNYRKDCVNMFYFFSAAFLLRRDNSRKQVFLVIATWLIMGLYTNVGIM